MSTPISSLMTAQVRSVDLDDSIASVERLLAGEGLGWVPVRDAEGGVLGVISQSDLVRFHAEGRDGDGVRAWQMCTFRPLVVAPDESAQSVARQMVDKGIHHVVVSSGGELAGVVSSLDFVRAFAVGDAAA